MDFPVQASSHAVQMFLLVCVCITAAAGGLKGLEFLLTRSSQAWRNFWHNVAALQEVAHELRPNGGGSMRDQITTVAKEIKKVAGESTENLQVTKEIKSEQKDLTKRVDRLESIATETGKREKLIEWKLSRKILHDGKQTLPGSDLMVEAQKYIDSLTPEERAEMFRLEREEHERAKKDRDETR